MSSTARTLFAKRSLMRKRWLVSFGLLTTTALVSGSSHASDCVRGCGPGLRDEKACCLAASTPPGDVATAPACRANQLAFEAWTDGAMGSIAAELWVRNVSDEACQVSGSPRVELVDRKGRVVQSTSVKSLKQRGKPVVLVPGAFAHADLGVIASNVCGGDQSDTLVLSTAGTRRRIPFAIGGPLHREQCQGASLKRHARPHPGELRVGVYQPFGETTNPPG